MNPRETKKAVTINQMVVLRKPSSDSAIFSVPVRAVRAMAIMAIAPIGSGLVIRATMVPTKMANRCQADVAL